MSFEEAKKLDDHFVMHTFARKPVLLVEGSGMEVKDDEGKTYLDFIAGIGVGLGTGFAGMSATAILPLCAPSRIRLPSSFTLATTITSSSAARLQSSSPTC